MINLESKGSKIFQNWLRFGHVEGFRKWKGELGEPGPNSKRDPIFGISVKFSIQWCQTLSNLSIIKPMASLERPRLAKIWSSRRLPKVERAKRANKLCLSLNGIFPKIPISPYFEYCTISRQIGAQFGKSWAFLKSTLNGKSNGT